MRRDKPQAGVAESIGQITIPDKAVAPAPGGTASIERAGERADFDRRQDTGHAGACCSPEGRLAEAENAYQSVLQHAPDHGDAHQLMCALTLQRGDIARAITHGKAAVKAYPAAPDCWNNLGAALRRNGDTDAAQNAFETALKADPTHRDAGLNLASLLAESGAFQSAAEACRQVLAAAPENHTDPLSARQYSAGRRGARRRARSLAVRHPARTEKPGKLEQSCSKLCRQWRS